MHWLKGEKTMTDLYSITADSITGDSISLSEYRDQALLIVNLASQWGLTGQYAGLRALHNTVDNLTVLGFPCNQFGAQEPASNDEILAFAKDRFDVNFPMFAKIDVNGDQAAPLYQWLKMQIPGDIGWNFTKYLVNPKGDVIKRFDPQETPEAIGEALANLL
jgi:glutathione peroxidase